jgi:O-antigen/teichoic acid export membrane protein
LKRFYFDMRKVLFQSVRQQFGWPLVNQLLSTLTGFGLLFIVLRCMNKEDTGKWMLFLSAISLSDMLIQGFLQTFVVKQIALNSDDENSISQIHSHALLLSITAVSLVSVSLSVFLFLIPLQGWMALFCQWYPLFGFSMILFNVSLWSQTGKGNFKLLAIQRLIFCLGLFSTLFAQFKLNHILTLQDTAFSLLIGYVCASLYALRYTPFNFQLRHMKLKGLKEMAGYGKYTTGTLLGSSLLRNADTFMIGAFLSPAFVADYTLAQKFVELFEIMLRTVASRALPTLVKCQHHVSDFSKRLLTTLTSLTLLFIPISILISYYAFDLLSLISGSDKFGQSAILVRVFMIYVILLPADRLIGVALEAAGLPGVNLLKMLGIVLVNLTGNYLSLYYFASTWGMALVSSIAILTGIVYGTYRLIDKRKVILTSPLIYLSNLMQKTL